MNNLPKAFITAILVSCALGSLAYNHKASAQDLGVIYPTYPGTTVPNLMGPRTLVQQQGRQTIFRPTLPGTSIPDYSGGGAAVFQPYAHGHTPYSVILPPNLRSPYVNPYFK